MEVSVVIPLFNKEQYISRAIDSVINQTVPPSEIIVVNDGSTDHSENVVRMYTDPRICLITQGNAGEGAARNRGIDEARFELIAFLDADDEWKPDFLMNIRRLRSNFPDCGAYATSYEIAESNGNTSYPILKDIPPAPWIGIIPNLFKLMQISNPFSSSSIAIPKDVCVALNGFPVGLKLGADKLMWIRLGSKYPIAFCNSHPVIYHTDAMYRVCNTTDIKTELQIVYLLDKMLENQEVPLALLADITDLSTAIKLQRSKLLIKNGDIQIARDLLKSIGNNQKYRRRILWWLFWSLMPYPIITKLTKKNTIAEDAT